MKLKLHGPNLSGAAQRKAQFHVHTADCQDNRFYGPGRKYGGEDDGTLVDAETPVDVCAFIYADHLSDYGLTVDDPEGQEMLDSWLADFHFAPCVEFERPAKGQKEGQMATKTTHTNEQLSEKLRSALVALPAELVVGKTCEVVKVNGKTAGYAMFGARKLRVDVPAGGKLVRYPVRNGNDLSKATAALKRRAKEQAKHAKTK